MKAIVRKDDYGKDIAVEQIPIPSVAKGQVLVKVMATPCNPSDLEYLTGIYGFPNKRPKPPTISGLEGSGIIEAVGEGVSKELVGKRVGIFCETYNFEAYHGNWAQYTVKREQDIYVLKDQSMSFEDSCYLFVNPMSVMAMWHIIEKDKHTGVIHTAASSSLGRSLFKLCKRIKIPIINVVRREEHVKKYAEMEAECTLSQNDPNFDTKLAAAMDKIRPSVCFDAVVGELGGKIFKALPHRAHYYIYGGLSGKPLPEVTVADTLFAKKQVRGFWLSEELPGIPRDAVLKDLDYICEDIKREDSCFKQKIVGEYKLEDYQKVVSECAAVAAEGKLILKPNP